MISNDNFLHVVKTSFTFLENDFGFKYHGFEEKARLIKINYLKKELLVSIIYNRPNNYIEVNVYNYISKVEPGKYDWKYSVGLEHIIKKETGVYYDFDSIKSEDLNTKIEVNSMLLKKYGLNILSGAEWYSWGKITGYEQYVPPELP
ncbi:hypothetical protein [Flavobacterium sp. GT3R68]|uniref:hypothetical protein n=1 Tax=Flavobacterium sp. GT3R68 TaxID=2594437 RepID=UPI000F86CF08|nr:hypothetical protein [Flavobacterium sp. GT3R68]RTY85983.1 hypothetical protein EKL32_28170 [Flavobacterium sp. GSN2]TRW90119.1 hypothetical protein FNW07_11720 [Flavobacterium sp. GT3R68]